MSQQAVSRQKIGRRASLKTHAPYQASTPRGSDKDPTPAPPQ
jgi:hypothetical protein